MAGNQHMLRDYSLPFAAWELRLYLNSHPSDRCALRLYHQLLASAPCATYAHTDLNCSSCCDQHVFGALSHMDDAACPCSGNLSDLMNGWDCACDQGDCCPLRWDWVEDPWPWDGCCGSCGN